MYTVIKFHARYKRNGLKFTAFDYRPRNPGIEKIVMENPGWRENQKHCARCSCSRRKEAEAHARRCSGPAWIRFRFFMV